MIECALTPLSWLFRGGILFRHFLYDQKILTKKYSQLPVVSIGNVMAGGAGKTQVALLLAAQLAKDFPVAILSRGYRGKAEHGATPLVVDINRHTAVECGDEPWLLASRLAHISHKCSAVVVNKNRFKSALYAQSRGARLLVLDDGMQHRQLHRDFEIVVIDGRTPFGPFLPKGRLREDLSRLKEVDLILFIGEPESSLKNRVSTLSSAPQVTAKIVSCGFFQLDGRPVEDLKDKPVGIFCGIGNPTRFVATVEELGLHVTATHFSSDHQLIGEKQLYRFAVHCKQRGAMFLVCTEKDRVKLSPRVLPLPIIWLKAELEVINNHKAWIRTVNEIKQLAQVNRSLT